MKGEKFFKLYQLMSKLNIISDDFITLGNLAYFVNGYADSINWERIANEIETMSKNGNKQNAYLIIINGIYNVATIKGEVSPIEIIFDVRKQQYLIQKLSSIVLFESAKYFPFWFMDLMKHQNVSSGQDAYDIYLEELRTDGQMRQIMTKENNKWALAYLIEKNIASANWLEVAKTISSTKGMHYANEVSWLAYQLNYKSYLSDLLNLKRNGLVTEVNGLYSYKDRAETVFRVTESLYNKKQLRYFDAVPSELKDKFCLLIDTNK